MATFATATLAGSLFWEASGPDDAAWGALFAPSVLVRGIAYAICLLAILGAHEMGHYLACRRYGIDATLPFFLPGFPFLGTFGAVIRVRSPIPHRRALFDVAAAGPLAGFAVALPILVVGVARSTPIPAAPESGAVILQSPLVSQLFERVFHGDSELNVNSLYGAAWVGLLVTAMNLFPVGQLDGGHAVYAISRRAHRVVSWLTIAALGATVLEQTLRYRSLSVYAVWLAILLFMRDRHPVLVDDAQPLDPGRKLLGALLGVVFALSFTPVPFRIV